MRRESNIRTKSTLAQRRREDAARQREADRLARLQHTEWHRVTGKTCDRPGCPDAA